MCVWFVDLICCCSFVQLLSLICDNCVNIQPAIAMLVYLYWCVCLSMSLSCSSCLPIIRLVSEHQSSDWVNPCPCPCPWPCIHILILWFIHSDMNVYCCVVSHCLRDVFQCSSVQCPINSDWLVLFLLLLNRS